MGDTIPICLRSSFVRLSVDRNSKNSICKTISPYISSVQVAVLSIADHVWYRGGPWRWWGFHWCDSRCKTESVLITPGGDRIGRHECRRSRPESRYRQSGNSGKSHKAKWLALVKPVAVGEIFFCVWWNEDGHRPTFNSRAFASLHGDAVARPFSKRRSPASSTSRCHSGDLTLSGWLQRLSHKLSSNWIFSGTDKVSSGSLIDIYATSCI